MSKENAQIMKEAHELAPVLADALDGLRDDLTIPAGDEREWSQNQRMEYEIIVDISEALVRGDDCKLGMALRERWLQEAKAARDDALDRDQKVRRVGSGDG